MLLKVRVVPRSSRNEVVGEMSDGVLKIKLTAAPIDGAANEALINLLSKHYGVPRGATTIVRGARGKNKIVEIKSE